MWSWEWQLAVSYVLVIVKLSSPAISRSNIIQYCTVYPKKYARGFCFAVLWCGYTLTDFPISIRLTSLALWQSNDCPSASKATLMNMDKYFMWIHYERLHNHNKAKHNKTVCIFLGIYYKLCWFQSCSRDNTLESQKTPHIAPSWTNHGMSILEWFAITGWSYSGLRLKLWPIHFVFF